MRLIGFLIVFFIGAIFGAVWTTAMLPDMTLTDVYGEWAATLDVTEVVAPMASAMSGIMVGVAWGVFGIVVAGIFAAVSAVFGGRERY